MSNTNRVTLAQLDKMTAENAQGIPLDQIKALLEDVAEKKANLKKREDKLFVEMDRRVKDAAAQARKAKKEDTGTVRVVVDGETISADLKKIVKWLPDEMEKGIDALLVKNPQAIISEYVKVTLEVAESKWKAWPTDIKAIFEPARVVSCGKPTYEFVKVAS